MMNDYGARVVRAVDGLKNTYVIETVGDPNEDEVLISAALHNDDRVAYSHPNFIAPKRLHQQVPADTYYANQWHLNNTGQDGATPGADIDAPEAWMDGLGLNVVVGIYDDAVDVDHLDLRDNYTGAGHDPVANDGDPRPKFVGDEHGTAVMGLICAAPNSQGVRGVAPLAKFTCSRGVTDMTSLEQDASVYTFARQEDVDVHSNSWGYVFGMLNPPIVADAINTAFEEGRDPDGPQGEMPPRGMVVLFSTGNDGLELDEGSELSTLQSVIGVGASNAADRRSQFSNYGVDINIVAPSNDTSFTTFLPGMVTTDNTDSAGYVEDGYNIDGFNDFGFPNLANPDYTREFGGTSASCPVAAGVAAIVVGINPALTATQVRLILEHTCDQIALDEAAYSGLTQRSLFYGYGRVNARKAAQAAVASLTNGNMAWPERPTNINVDGTRLSWTNNVETARMLVVQSQAQFGWFPTDGTSYSVGQEVAPGVTVGTITEGGSYDFPLTTGTTYFGLYAVNLITRYSFGVGVDSLGNVIDPGPTDVIDDDTGGGGGGIVVGEIPAVSITASPLMGNSPLTVEFRGNALTDSAIESLSWDFGDGTTANQAAVSHTYTVGNGTTQRFIARFTVIDGEGDVGSRSVAIDVTDPNTGGGGSVPPPDTSVRIRVGTPGSPDSDVDTGVAPFMVELSVDPTSLPGTLSSILWDLGDGTVASSLTVQHTYERDGVYAVTVTISTQTASNTVLTTTSTRLITVTPGAPNNNTNTNSTIVPPRGGGRAGTCGVGMVYAFVGLLGLALIRRLG